MLFNCIKDKRIELAKKGAIKFLEALKKFFRDSKLINEIYDRADKDLFLPAASSKQYRYIESIKEDEIYDNFIELCFDQQSLDVDITSFVEEHYSQKTKKAKEYIIYFFNELNLIIFNVLKNNASPETKIILKGQEIGFDQIMSKLSSLEKQLTDKNNEPTTVVTYCANMQNSRWAIENYSNALVNKKIFQTISLSLNNSILNQKDGNNFWELETKSLQYNFTQKVIPLLESGSSFSVFGLAPIPLLIFYGNLFANRPNIDIYQLKKNPSTWNWEKDANKLDIKTTIHSNLKINDEAILILSFSGKVNINNLSNIIDIKSVPTIELSIDNPYDDFLRSKEQLDEFLIEFRKTKAKLLECRVKNIHLFAAIPIAFAIGIGQIYNPNFDAILTLYDYKQGIYTKAITIGDKE